MIDPFLSCLACDITFFTRIFRKIRAKHVISQTRQDKKGAMNWGWSHWKCHANFTPATQPVPRPLPGHTVVREAHHCVRGQISPFLCNGGFPCVIFQKIMQQKKNEKNKKCWKIRGLPPHFRRTPRGVICRSQAETENKKWIDPFQHQETNIA